MVPQAQEGAGCKQTTYRMGNESERTLMDALQEVMAKREAEDLAARYVSVEKDRQRKLAAQTHNKRVHDIIDMQDVSGQDLLIWIFANKDKPEVSEGETCIAMIIFLDADNQRVQFEDVVVKKGSYMHVHGGDPALLVTKLRAGSI